MKRDNYKELIEDDAISAILIFREMTVPNRIKAVLWCVDTMDMNHPNAKIVLADNFRDVLLCIRSANKNWGKNINEFKNQGLVGDEATISADNRLIEEAAELYYKKHPEERPVEVEITEEIIAEEEDRVKNFYRLLT